MVQTPTDTCGRASWEYLQARQKTIDWLKNLGLPPLPVAPALDPYDYPKIAKSKSDQGDYCPLTADFKPIPLYTGKNPSYLKADGTPRLINHKKFQTQLPTDQELETWFTNPQNGVGTLGGWNNTIWIDLDVKQFPSQQECDRTFKGLLADHPELQSSWLEKTHSGGYRLAVRVRKKPDFTNFALTSGGNHVGEALGTGRFTVLAPTIGPSDNPYQSINRAKPLSVESLESISIFPTRTQDSTPTPRIPLTDAPNTTVAALSGNNSLTLLVPGSIPLEMLGHNTSRAILRGVCSTGDRSEALTAAVREWHGWQNWSHTNGVRVQGTPEDLAQYAGVQLGLDSDRIGRILKTINPARCHPAAEYKGGEESCWKKIRRIDKITFEEKCPVPIKNTLTTVYCQQKKQHGHNSSTTRVREPETLRAQIADILKTNLSRSKQLEALSNLAKTTGHQFREIQALAEAIDSDLEVEAYRFETKRELDTLETFKSRNLTLNHYLPESYAEPFTKMAQWMAMPSAAFLTTLLPTFASCLHPATRFVACECLDFSEPPIVYGGLVTESGQRKSPLLRAVTKALKELQADEEERFKLEQQEYEQAYKAWESQKDSLSPQEWKDCEPSPAKPIREFYVDKATSEALDAIKGKQSDTGFVCIKDELNGLFGSYGAYKNGRGEDKESILAGFGGGGTKKNLKNGERVSLLNDSLSIIGAIQPGVLRKRMGNFDDEQGEWGRFLWCIIPLKAMRLPESDTTFALTFLKYLYATARELPPQQYHFDPEAKAFLHDTLYDLEQRRVNHPQAGMRAAIAKMGSYMVRLSGLLHIIWELNTNRIPSQEIPLERVKAAQRLVEFYLSQVTLIHSEGASVTDNGELSHRLSAILSKLKHFGELTARMLQSSISWLRKTKPTDLRRDLMELAQMGYGVLQGKGNRLRLILAHQTADSADPVAPIADITADRSGVPQPLTGSQVQTTASETADTTEDIASHNQQISANTQITDTPNEEGADTASAPFSAEQQLSYNRGDRVGIVCGEPDQIGKTGRIMKVDPNDELSYNVMQDDGEFSAWFRAEELELVNLVP